MIKDTLQMFTGVCGVSDVKTNSADVILKTTTILNVFLNWMDFSGYYSPTVAEGKTFILVFYNNIEYVYSGTVAKD